MGFSDYLVNATLAMAKKEDDFDAGNLFHKILGEWIIENNIGEGGLFELSDHHKVHLVTALINNNSLNNGYDIYGGVSWIENEIYNNIQEDKEFSLRHPQLIEKIELWSKNLEKNEEN